VCVAAEETYLPLDRLDLPDLQHATKHTRSFAYTESSAGQFRCSDGQVVRLRPREGRGGISVECGSLKLRISRITTPCLSPSSGREPHSVRAHIPIPEMTDTVVHATLNDLPQELLDDIIDLLPQDVNLKTCALVGKRWVRRCQERLFERLTLSSPEAERWTRPVEENQPLLFSYVKRLTLVGVYPLDWVDVNFGRHMSCFGGDGSSGPENVAPCRVHTLKLVDSSVDVDGEVISRVLGPLRSSVRTVIMSSVSIPPVKDLRPFFCMFSQLQNVHVPGPQFSSVIPDGNSRLAKDFTLPPLDGELKLSFLYHGGEGVLSSLSKLPLRFHSISVSPPGGQCDIEIDNILATCGKTVKAFHVRRMKLGMYLLSARTSTTHIPMHEIPQTCRSFVQSPWVLAQNSRKFE